MIQDTTGDPLRDLQILRARWSGGGYRPVPLLTGEKYTKKQGWVTEALRPRPLCTFMPAEPDYLNTGYLCNGLRVFDCDVDDPDLCARLDALIVERFGASPKRTRSNSPRWARVYRAAVGEPRKVVAAGVHGKMEVLGRGQQLHAHGLHPSGVEPRWDSPPLGLFGTRALTEDEVHAFLTDIAPLLGAKPPARAKEGPAARLSAHGAQAPIEDVVAALDLIPNDGPADWNGWTAVGLAVWAATDGSTDGFEAFSDWSAKNMSYDPTETLARWEGMTASPPSSIGYGRLDYLARQADPSFARPSALERMKLHSGAADFGVEIMGEPPVVPPGGIGIPPRPPGAVKPEVPDGYYMTKTKIVNKMPEEVLLHIFENVCTLLLYDKDVWGTFRYNEFSGDVMLTREIPRIVGVEKDVKINDITPVKTEDYHILELMKWIQRKKFTGVSKLMADDAVTWVSRQHRFNPVLEHLRGLDAWDGVPRLSTWLIDHLSVEDDADGYARKVGRMFILSMLARALRPGCQVDYTLILEGGQGTGKTAMVRALAGDPDWFLDNTGDITHKDAYAAIQGRWVVELAELASTRKADVESTKAFLTRREDKYRPSYGRRFIDQPRTCVFVGTTNEDGYLKDHENRRFWPVTVTSDELDIERFTAARGQILAEGLTALRQGEKWWPDRQFERSVIAPQQRFRRETDLWDEPIRDFLAATPDNIECRLWDVFASALGMVPERVEKKDEFRAAAIMKKFGWVKRKTNGARLWRRGPEAEPYDAMHAVVWKSERDGEGHIL